LVIEIRTRSTSSRSEHCELTLKRSHVDTALLRDVIARERGLLNSSSLFFAERRDTPGLGIRS